MDLNFDRNTGILECVGKLALAGIALNAFAILAICQIFFSLGQGLLESLGLIKS